MNETMMTSLVLAMAALVCVHRLPTDAETCTGAPLGDIDAAVSCERAWLADGGMPAAVAGARHALVRGNAIGVLLWAAKAPETLEGARIYHFVGEALRNARDLDGAQRWFMRALELRLRIGGDAVRTVNTLYNLLALVQSHEPPARAIVLAKLMWEQAELAGAPLSREFANSALVGIFIDLGELATAAAVVERMTDAGSPALRALAQGRLNAARGRHESAVAHFQRATDARNDPGAYSEQVLVRCELARSLLQLGRVAEARTAVDDAAALAGDVGARSLAIASQLAAAQAEVALAEGRLDAALDRVARGLDSRLRDAAKVLLLGLRGDALAGKGEVVAAEQAWRAAADSLEDWRASIPMIQLRSGLIAFHRHALEAWLDSAAARDDLDGVREVARRKLGRGLADRVRQRESDAPMSLDEQILDVVDRLTIHHQPGATSAILRDLHEAPHDFIALLTGARTVWALQRRDGKWSVRPVGDRAAILALVDAHRERPDDRELAARLGDALFPPDALPGPDHRLAVMLDRELADLPLAGLHTGDRYLVEQVQLVEVLAPDLLFQPVPERRWAWGPAIAVGDARGDLPDGATEVRDVAHMLGIEARLGGAATRAAVTGATGRVLHVATHAAFRGGLAVLELADGTLSSHEIMKHQIAPRLAVIASCRSQVADDPATSLVAAFLAAGTAGVIGVKRSLADSDGLWLMRELYRRGGADDPVAALAHAQRAAIAAGRPPHTWSTVSFFGVGGWLE